jgi:hypothetical protein
MHHAAVAQPGDGLRYRPSLSPVMATPGAGCLCFFFNSQLWQHPDTGASAYCVGELSLHLIIAAVMMAAGARLHACVPVGLVSRDGAGTTAPDGSLAR